MFQKIFVFVLVEEDDGEVFKVKKSKQSSRLAKRREKERRRPDGDNNKYDHTHLEVYNTALYYISKNKSISKLLLQITIYSSKNYVHDEMCYSSVFPTWGSRHTWEQFDR